VKKITKETRPLNKKVLHRKNKNKETIYVAKVGATLEKTFQKSRHQLKCFKRRKIKKNK